MNYLNYLKKHQEIPYKIFLNCLEKDTFFHAYLLSGPTGTPLFEIAKYITKCLLTGEHKYLEENNIISERIDTNNYSDLIIIDGKENQIKIDDIRKMENQFSQSANEKKGIKVYIINNVENMAPDAINALLKFLEEPDEFTYAFLTTENEYRVLPTILSRTEIIHFAPLDQNELIDDCLKEDISKEDAELLSFFYNDPTVIKEKSSNQDYLNARDYIYNFINLLENKTELKVFVENELIKKLKTKQSIRFFFDLLIIFFKDTLRFTLNEDIILKEAINYLTLIAKNITHIDDAILKLMDYRNELNFNLNTSLLLVNFVENIVGD